MSHENPEGLMAGVISVVIGAVVIAIGTIIVLRFLPAFRGHNMSAELVAAARTRLAIVVAAVLFLVGFFGEMRRN
jgi:hypothetical protein